MLPAEVLAEMPLPSDPKVTFLGGLFVLGLLTAAYVASEIVLPVVFAITLKLLLQPALRMLEVQSRRYCCASDAPAFGAGRWRLATWIDVSEQEIWRILGGLGVGICRLWSRRH